MMGQACNKCTSTMLYNQEPPLSSFGLDNVFHAVNSSSTSASLVSPPSTSFQKHDGNILSRTFNCASFVLSRRQPSLGSNKYHDVTKRVLNSKRVKRALKDEVKQDFDEILEENAGSVDPQELTKSLEVKQKLRAIQLIERMKSCISSSLLRIAGWILYKLLSRIFTSIIFHKGQIEQLKRRCQINSTNNQVTKTPIIYLPMHRSHLDYILISFILYLNDISPPLVAAGDNLLIPFFGNLLRGLGAFFIKRRLDDDKSLKKGRKDLLYRAILHSYMVENLKDNSSMEFFLEGGRSRSGKALLPKAGLLSVIIDSVYDSVIDDAYIVPVAISYEKLIDGSFVSEQLGKPKVKESFGQALKAIWTTLHSNFGSVRVDFCQPFSLRQYLKQVYLKSHQIPNSITCKVNGENGDDDKCVACTGLRSCNNSTYGLDIVVSEDKRSNIIDLAEHIVHDAFNSTALMSTNLVSFLLLTKHRKGVTLSQLTQSLNWLRKECSKRNRDVGFTGESIDVIKHACNLLGKNLIKIEKLSMEWTNGQNGLNGLNENNNSITNNNNPNMIISNNNNFKVVFIKPNSKLPQVLELQYYSNSCVTLFLLESVITNAIYSLVNDFDFVAKSNDGNRKSQDKNNNQIKVNHDDVVQKSIELCNILQYEFIFAPCCTSIKDLITNTIDSMILNGLLSDEESHENLQLKDRYKHFEWNDDDDGWDCNGINNKINNQNYNKRKLRVSIDKDSVEQFQFMRSILMPYIESYWLVSCSLIKLIGTERLDKKFFIDMLSIAKQKQSQGLLCNEESIATEPMKNAMKLFESWQVISSYTHESSDKIYYLNSEYDSDQAVSDVILRIEQFKK